MVALHRRADRDALRPRGGGRLAGDGGGAPPADLARRREPRPRVGRPPLYHRPGHRALSRRARLGDALRPDAGGPPPRPQLRRDASRGARRAGGGATDGAPSSAAPAPPAAAQNGRKRAALLGAIASPALELTLAVDEEMRVRSWHCADGAPCFQFQLRDRGIITSAAASGGGAGGGDASGGGAGGGSGGGSGGDMVSAISFDFSGRRLLVGRRDGVVRVYNYSSGTCLAECVPPRRLGGGGDEDATEITCVRGIKDGHYSYIVACGWSREVWVWPDARDAPPGSGHRIEATHALRGHREDISCLTHCSPNLLATGGYDGAILQWNLAAGTRRGMPMLHAPVAQAGAASGSAPLGGGGGGFGAREFAHRSSSMISVDALAFLHLPGETPNPLLVSSGADGRLRFWSVVSSSLLFVLPLSPPPGIYSAGGSDVPTIGALHWHPKSMRLVVGDADGRIGVWDGKRLKKTLSSAATPTPAVIDRIYSALAPHLRWHAHEASVIGLSVLDGGDAPRRPPRRPRAGAPAPSMSVLEATLAQANGLSHHRPTVAAAAAAPRRRRRRRRTRSVTSS